MKKLITLLFAVLATSLYAIEFEKVQLTPEGIGVVMVQPEELGDEIYLGLDYEKEESGKENYYIRVKFKRDNVMVSTGRKMLLKLKDGSKMTLTSTGFEDKSTKGMYAIRWVGWKDNYVETKHLDLQVIYPIEKSDLDKIMNIGVIKTRIDTDAKFFEWGKKEKDDRYSYLINSFYKFMQPTINRDPQELYKDF